MITISRHTKNITGWLTASIICTLLILPKYVIAEKLNVSDFSTQGLIGWSSKSFNGMTEYRLTQENGKTVVQATSQGTASGLVKEICFDPKRYRYLQWSWKILDTIEDGDETTKVGDDYAARIYVIFPGTFFWQTKVLNYIWANQLTRGTSIPNAYTSSAIMVAVQSGPDNSGEWHNETRDIFADYKNIFGSNPGEVRAIAIMTDTDDTGKTGVAWYGDINVSTRP